MWTGRVRLLQVHLSTATCRLGATPTKISSTSHRSKHPTGWTEPHGTPIPTDVLGKQSRDIAPGPPTTLRGCSKRDPSQHPSRRRRGNRHREPSAPPKLARGGGSRGPGPRPRVGATLRELGWVSATLHPRGLPGGLHPADPSQEPAPCTRHRARPAPHFPGRFSNQVPSSPLPVSEPRSGRMPGARMASRSCGQSTCRTEPGAYSAETRAPEDAVGAAHPPWRGLSHAPNSPRAPPAALAA